MAKANAFGAFMRRYGLKIFYFIFTPTFMAIYVSNFVEDNSEKAVPLEYAWYQTLWIGIFRIGGIILLLPSLAFVATYFFANFPELAEGPDTDLKPGFIDEREKSAATENGVQDGPASKNGRLSCFIVRIITRGDYPELIRRNVAFHINLVERYCHCDRLEAHVVTEKPLSGDYEVGKTGRVREVVVPADYKTKNGTLAKARNMAYWIEACSKDSGYPPDDKTWILTLDEDSFITDSFMRGFLDTFLPSGAHCSVSPTVLELPPTSGIAAGFEESFFITLQATGMWLEGAILKSTPLWFRGAAYVVRRDVDKEIGHAYPPELSITEDHVFGHYFADSRFKVGYINGWNWEGGAPGLLGLIKQRGRWFRGHMYAFLKQRMSVERRIWCAIRLILFYFVNGPCMACAVVGSVFLYTGNFWNLVPAGPRLWPWDYLAPFAFANYFYANIFGAWHTMSTKRAALYTLGTCCWIGIATTFAVHLTELIWTLITMADDFYHRRQRYEVTEKKQK